MKRAIKVLVIGLIFVIGCVSVRVITGNDNTSDRENTGLDATVNKLDSL